MKTMISLKYNFISPMSILHVTHKIILDFFTYFMGAVFPNGDNFNKSTIKFTNLCTQTTWSHGLK